jgi:hypothetical protein
MAAVLGVGRISLKTRIFTPQVRYTVCLYICILGSSTISYILWKNIQFCGHSSNWFLWVYIYNIFQYFTNFSINILYICLHLFVLCSCWNWFQLSKEDVYRIKVLGQAKKLPVCFIFIYCSFTASIVWNTESIRDDPYWTSRKNSL